MKNLMQVVLLGTALVVTGCAEYPKRINAAYIPSIVYRGASCSEIMNERAKLVQHVNFITGKQQRMANTDTAIVTTFLVVFWPAIGGLPFTKDQSAQLSVARGHYDALVNASQEQGCTTTSSPAQNVYQQSGNWKRYGAEWKRYRGDFPPL